MDSTRWRPHADDTRDSSIVLGNDASAGEQYVLQPIAKSPPTYPERQSQENMALIPDRGQDGPTWSDLPGVRASQNDTSKRAPASSYKSLGSKESVVMTADSQLAPRRLLSKRRKERYFWIAFFFIVPISAFILFLGASFIYRSTLVSTDYASGDCEGARARGFEASLLVNLLAATNLTFSQAKLIDLVWDAVIGQGGKFLHGWWLYRVVTRTLTAIMESGAIPVGPYLELSFSPASWFALWASLTMPFAKPSFRPIYIVVWLVFSIGYVLSFNVLWSAATGYISGSVPAYAVLGHSYTSARSPELTLCWVFDDKRVALNGTRRIVNGPQFGVVGSKLDYANWDKLNLIKQPLPDDMNEFVDVYSYFMTKYTLRQMHRQVSQDQTLENLTATFSVGNTGLEFPFDPSGDTKVGTWQFENAKRDSGKQRGQLPGLPDDSPIAAYETTFRFNYSSSRASTADVHLAYNSTIRLDGELLKLRAPFLNGSTDCAEALTDNPLEVCTCLNGVPIESMVDVDNPTGCVSDTGYSWGFSSVMTGVGIILETLWLVSSWLMLHKARRNSSLVRAGRSGEGTVRSVLDAAEVLTEHVGNQHSAYTDKELWKQLKSCRPVGFVVESRDGVDHIGIRQIDKAEPGEPGMRRRVKLEADTLYG